MTTNNGLTLRIRTKDNLMKLLIAGKSGEWKIGKNKEQEISKVQIFNWDGSLVLEASLDIDNTTRTEDNRLIVGLSSEDARIVKCNPSFQWVGQNPIKYFNENSQQESEEAEDELSSESIIVECYKKGSQLKIRVISPGYDPELNVKFPRDLREEGARYSVEILEEVQGKYYSAKGKIEKLELETKLEETEASVSILERLLQAAQENIELWNEWRKNNPDLKIDLSDADLSGANLSDADLSDSNLTNAKLLYANLTCANLSNGNLSNANLTGANLNGANLIKADLSNANLTGTILENVSLVENNGDYYLIQDNFEKEKSEATKSDSVDDFENQVTKICEQVFREPIRLIDWQLNEEENKFNIFFRDLAGNRYFEMLITENEPDKWSSEHRIYSVFQSLLDQEGTWMKLTEKATEEDWKALDKLFSMMRYFPESQVMLAGADLIGEEAIDEALERFGFYIPDEDLLPVFLFENKLLNMIFVSYFKHPDKCAGENMVQDNNAHRSEIINSLPEAIDRFIQKLDYYAEELVTKSKSEKTSVSEQESVSEDTDLSNSDLKELGENIPSFSEIIKDFLSKEYPDCIQDVMGENYVYVSEQKLLNNWEAIKANGKKQEVIETAVKWAEFFQNYRNTKNLVQLSLPKLTLLEFLDLPTLSKYKLVFQSGGGFLIHSQGLQITENNTNDCLLVCNLTYEIIRILMVQILDKRRKYLNRYFGYWMSEVEIVTLEPEVIKKLIEKISKSGGIPTVQDLEIRDNSIFFNSMNDGCYGYDDRTSPELFKILFELYDGPLIAREWVSPREDQGYHFTCKWVKPKGQVNWDDENTYWIHRNMVTKNIDLVDRCGFHKEDLWLIHDQSRFLDNMPKLSALVQKAVAAGFDDWFDDWKRIDYYDDLSEDGTRKYISYDTVLTLLDLYWDEEIGDEEDIYDEIEKDMAEWVGEIIDDNDDYCSFDMPF
jgi:uncharacterized protein YjbI with pentapeptide repeats